MVHRKSKIEEKKGKEMHDSSGEFKLIVHVRHVLVALTKADTGGRYFRCQCGIVLGDLALLVATERVAAEVGVGGVECRLDLLEGLGG